MKKIRQTGSAAIVALVIVVGVILLAAAVVVTSYVSAANYGAAAETGLKATWENNQNILAQNTQKILEAAQVTDMQRDDIIKITHEAISGRYGADGSKAVFQAIQEKNPNVSEGLYVKIQQLVEAARDEFKNAQKGLIDQKRVYSYNLQTVWRGFWMRMAGYPKVNLDDYKAITTDYAAGAFKAGKESGPLRLRPAAK